MAAIKRDPRIGLIAKIHVGKKQLAMADDSYRAMLKRITGKDSSAGMTLKQLEDVVDEFKRLGFKKKPKRSGARKMAGGGLPSKIRALWLNLYHLGEINDPSEDALAAYARRMTKVSALQWLKPYQADMVIRGLRGWLERVGYKHPVQEDVKALLFFRRQRAVDDPDVELNHEAIAAKVFLLRRQMEILGPKVNRVSLDLGDRVCAEMIAADALDHAIEKFGAAVRAHKEDQT